jgi:hypothetical protein
MPKDRTEVTETGDGKSRGGSLEANTLLETRRVARIAADFRSKNYC